MTRLVGQIVTKDAHRIRVCVMDAKTKQVQGITAMKHVLQTVSLHVNKTGYVMNARTISTVKLVTSHVLTVRMDVIDHLETVLVDVKQDPGELNVISRVVLTVCLIQ